MACRRCAAVAALLCACLLAVAPAFAIVNGTIVGDARFAARYPWAVALVSPSSGGVCTAQLIAPRWVLTAAHCTSTGSEVRVGSSDRSQARVVAVAEAIQHPRYDARAGTWDIGLLRLAEPVVGPVVQPATAADAAALLREKALAAIAGWGRRATGLGYSQRLVESEVELDDLRREDSRFIFIDRASGPCGGDSGGPLLLRRADGSWVLAGIASRVAGDLCAMGGGVSLYTDVAAARGFIEGHVAELAR